MVEERSGELAMSEERVKQVGERSCIALAIASLQPPFALGALCSNINIGNKSRAGSCSCTRRVCLLRNHGNHSRPSSQLSLLVASLLSPHHRMQMIKDNRVETRAEIEEWKRLLNARDGKLMKEMARLVKVRGGRRSEATNRQCIS